jgi:hypothetical protein
MGEKRNAYRWESQREGDNYEDQEIYGWIILR